MFAFHIQPDGTVDYIGEVLAQRRDTLRLNVLDAVMATGCGMWCLSDEIRDVPKAECRMFADKLVCLETALRINSQITQARGQHEVDG